MKFDAGRASAIFEKLGDPAFAGPDGEARVAIFVAGELERMGYQVTRREVAGSRFPQRAAPWIGWLGYGALITAVYVMLQRNDLVSAILACLLLLLGARWIFDALICNSIRLGRRRRPLDRAPLLIASLPNDSPPPIRVVFQAVLGGIRTDFFHSIRVNRKYIIYLHMCFTILVLFTFAAKFGSRPYLAVMMVSLTSGLFVFLWIMVLCVLSWDHRQSRLAQEMGEVERWGLTVLLELARIWPRDRSRKIEPVFVAAGGQRLDYAGSREVIRMLDSEWRRKPSLLVLFFAPGAGERLRPSENALRIAGLRHPEHDLARDAAESLWIQVDSNDPFALFSIWPFEKMKAAEPIALIGSDPMACFDGSVSPEALHRAAQLATEIALRWAKKHTTQAAAPDSSSPKSEPPN